MARSISLAAYLAYARGAAKDVQTPTEPRPVGELVWGHAVDVSRADALMQLADRLAQHRPGLRMLLTTCENTPPFQSSDVVLWQQLPEDSVAAAEAFVHHWAPDLCLWTGGNLQPALISQAERQGIVLFLIDADEDLLIWPSWRWFPDLPRALLSRFSVIMARSVNAARNLRRIGTGDTEVSVVGPFLEGAKTLPYNKSDHEDLSNTLRGRPVWLAAMLQPDEVSTALDAHRMVSKLAHRALLVIVPDDVSQSEAFRAQLEEGNWRFSVWSEAQMPEETTQVLLADTYGELGLWYLLASVTLMGSSLYPGQTGRDPHEPAAHGSAILYGPNVGRYLSSYSRFAEAGAARIVRDAHTLSAAVQRLIAPDQSAVMAHAAWEVTSQSAGVTDQIADLIQDTLDVLKAET